jgi:hypothetical protein
LLLVNHSNTQGDKIFFVPLVEHALILTDSFEHVSHVIMGGMFILSEISFMIVFV